MFYKYALTMCVPLHVYTTQMLKDEDLNLAMHSCEHCLKYKFLIFYKWIYQHINTNVWRYY